MDDVAEAKRKANESEVRVLNALRARDALSVPKDGLYQFPAAQMIEVESAVRKQAM